MKKMLAELRALYTRASFTVPVCLTVLFSHGYQILGTAIGVDDLKRDVYMGGVSAAQGRFTSPVLKHFFGLTESFPFFEKLFSVLLLVLSASVLCVIFRRASADKLHPAAYPLFASLLISYPLLAEIMAFRASDYEMALGTAVTSVVVWWMMDFAETRKKSYMLASGIVLVFLIALSEDFLIFYITVVLCVLLLEHLYAEKHATIKEMFLAGLWYALPAVVALIVKLILAELIIWIFAIPPTSTGENSIYWTSWDGGLLNLLLFMLFGYIQNYILYARWYFPIAVYVVAMTAILVLACFDSVKTKKGVPCLLWLGIAATTVSLMVVQGWVSPYRTVCMLLALPCAFVGMVLFDRAMHQKMQVLRGTVATLFCMVVFWQAVDMHKWCVVNQMRYEEEVRVIEQVYDDLCETVTDVTKPVVFVGGYDLSDNTKQFTHVRADDAFLRAIVTFRCEIVGKDPQPLYDKIYLEGETYSVKFTQTNAQPVIAWAVRNPGQREMFKFLLRHGIELTAPTEEMIVSAAAPAETMPAYPSQGYITETADYIIVKIGSTNEKGMENNPFIFG